MKKILLFIVFGYLIFNIQPAKSQIFLGKGKISGDFRFDGMYYIPDSLIGAEPVKEKVRANTYLNLLYTNGGFSAGARYEFYLFPLIDFEKIGYKGQGLTYFFAEYKNDFIQVTGGSFYEQFGNGLSLRAYEDRLLGIDNSILGVRIKTTPYKGITLKGIWGIQRKNFDFDYAKRNDQIRGLDAEIAFADFIPKMAEKGFTTTIGGSFVSRYEKTDDPVYIFPANVATFATRLNFGYKGFRFETEYAHKYNDPNETNNLIYKNGNALFASASYSMKGLGLSLSFLRADNMDFRSQRTATNNLLSINYIPAINRQYTYQLLSNYSYPSQANGEIGFQAQVNYKIPKKTKIGGKYGTDITLNYSLFHDIAKTMNPLADSLGNVSGTYGYSSPFFKFGDSLLYQDIGIEISRRFDKRWKLMIAYNYIVYNQTILQGHAGPLFKGHNVSVDLSCKINDIHALRLELQHLYSKQDYRSWMYAMLEYSINPHWFISIGDQWNYGNSEHNKRIHYFNLSAAFVTGTTRVSLSYGKTREGILCVGGVCRAVPASNGIALSVTTSF